jgi:hypothetical protein
MNEDEDFACARSYGIPLFAAEAALRNGRHKLVAPAARYAIARLIEIGQRGAALVALARYGVYLLDHYGLVRVVTPFGIIANDRNDGRQKGSIPADGYPLRRGVAEAALITIGRSRSKGRETLPLWELAMNGREILAEHGTKVIYELFNVDPPTRREDNDQQIEDLDPAEYTLVEEETSGPDDVHEFEGAVTEEDMRVMMALSERDREEDEMGKETDRDPKGGSNE